MKFKKVSRDFTHTDHQLGDLVEEYIKNIEDYEVVRQFHNHYYPLYQDIREAFYQQNHDFMSDWVSRASDYSPDIKTLEYWSALFWISVMKDVKDIYNSYITTREPLDVRIPQDPNDIIGDSALADETEVPSWGELFTHTPQIEKTELKS